MNTTEGEELLRVVAVETERRFTILEVEMSAFKEDIGDIKNMMATLVENMNKNKGFWAGAIAAGTALGATLGALLSYIFHFKAGS